MRGIHLAAIAVVSLLQTVLTEVNSGKCQRQIYQVTEPNGTIQSPGYPQSYMPMQTCIWRIKVAPGYRVHIHFEALFDVKRSSGCREEYVLISTRRQRLSDLNVVRNSKDSVTFCGARQPSNVSSPGNEMWIRFQATSGGRKGFRAWYGTEDINECLEQTNGGCHHNCVNTPGSFHCHCRSDFRLLPNGKKCIEDIVISFSKKRYRASLSVTAPVGTSILTVHATTGASQNPVYYSIVSVNGRPASNAPELFVVDPMIGTISLRRRLKKKTQYRLKVEARLNDVIFTHVTVNIRIYTPKTTPAPGRSHSLKFPSPIYSVIIPHNMLVGQTVLHLKVEKGRSLANATIRYGVQSITPFYRSPYFSLHPVTAALKIVRDLGDLTTDETPTSFFLQVVASVQGRTNIFASTQVSVVVVPEYAGNDYVKSSLEAVKNRTSTRESFDRLRFDKVKGQTEFSLHRMFRRPSPAAQSIAEADLKFNKIIGEIKREVAQEMIDDRARTGVVSVRLGASSVASASKLSDIIKELNCSLPKADCSDTEYHAQYRSYDGTCNNLGNPLWGAATMPFTRMLDPNYYDVNGLSDPVGIPDQPFAPELPSPHHVSKEFLVHMRKAKGNDNSYSHMMMQWGQFLDHDISFTAESDGAEKCFLPNCDGSAEDFEPPCFPIRYPDGSECTMFTRSAAACQTDNENVTPREQLNTITSFIDGSQIYGSSKDDADNLRDFIGNKGYLRLSIKYLLPFVKTHSKPPLNLCQLFGGCFAAGDFRVNEQIALVAMHTLWVREHNRIALKLNKINNHWTAEKVFQETRKIVGAMLQHISYNHYLPKILGENWLPPYGGYTNTHPGILNVFAAAAFRFGHSMVRPSFAMLDANFDPIAPEVPLINAFFNNKLVQQEGIEPVLLGLLANESMSANREIAAGLTKHLFQQKDSEHGFDLGALNIQRGRDHGLPGYGAWRRECNLSHAEIFQETNDEIRDAEARETLQDLYEEVEYADLWAAGLAEDPLPAAWVGPTFHCILQEQFRRLRDGDRFWFEKEGVFSTEQIHEIEKTSLSRVLCDNVFGIVSIQPDAFIAAKDDVTRVECTRIESMDLSKWKQHIPSPPEPVGTWSDWVYTVQKPTGSWGVSLARDICSSSVMDIECQKADGSAVELSNQVIHCKERVGVYCRNSEQPGDDEICANYRFRFLCSTIKKPVPEELKGLAASVFQPRPAPQCDIGKHPRDFPLSFTAVQHITIARAYDNEPNSEYLLAGKNKGQPKKRFLISFDTKKITRRAIVHSAKLYLYLVDFAPRSIEGKAPRVPGNSLEVYQITSTDWHPSNTTSVIPWHQDYLGIGKDVPAHRLAESERLKPGTGQRWIELDIQHAIRNWQIRQQPNYGLMLKSKKESNANAMMHFASSDHQFEDLRPRLVVCLTIPPW